MLQGIYDLLTGHWSIFVVYWIFITVVMTIYQLGALVFHLSFRYKKIFTFPPQPQLGATILVTIFDEEIEQVQQGLERLRSSFDEHCSQVHIICTIHNRWC